MFEVLFLKRKYIQRIRKDAILEDILLVPQWVQSTIKPYLKQLKKMPI